MSTTTASTAVRVTGDVPRVGVAPSSEKPAGTLTDYIEAAMNEAQFELMENGDYFGTIPSCQGAWADAPTVEECRLELRSVLEDWMLVGFRHGHDLPVVAGIDLNLSREPVDAEAD